MKDAIRIATDALIKPFEGYHRRLPDGSAHAYPDPGTGGAPWTIGWGTTGSGIGPDTVWSLDQCATALEKHVQQFALGVLDLSPNLEYALPRRFAAIISFAYNCGLGNYRISTLRKRVNEEDWESAGREILRWNKAAGRVLPGLTRRRKAESLMLISV
jgi:GH24 family phage-related lysozyme (muramidase)